MVEMKNSVKREKSWASIESTGLNPQEEFNPQLKHIYSNKIEEFFLFIIMIIENA